MKTQRTRAKRTKDLRTRAEDRLRKTQCEVAQRPEGDGQKLVHELQVRQIELEMQNEELHRAQGQLEAARDQLVELYDFAPVAYMTMDAAGVILEANLSAATLLGVSRESLVTKKLNTFIAPEDQDIFYAHHKLMVTSRKKQTCELRFRRKDGSAFFGRMESIAAPGPRRKRGQYLMAFFDQTRRKQAEEALREASQFNQQIIASAQEGIIVYGPDLKYRLWNPFMERFTGVPAVEVIGKHPLAVFPFLRKGGLMEQLRRALTGEPTDALDFHFKVPQSGCTGWASDTLAPLRNLSGEIIGVIGTVRDITARKREESALRRSESTLTYCFSHAPMGLQWLSASGIILRANQAQLDLLGYSEAEYVGHQIAEFHTDPALVGALLIRLAARETVTNFRLQIRRKDGSMGNVLLDANSLWDENHFVHSSVFTRDIGRRVELEREIMAASEREQRRIAQDLHDGLGQLLTGTFYLTSNLQQQLAAESRPEAQPLGRIVRLLDECITQTRSLARGLHPVKAEPNGLMVALKDLAARTMSLFQVRCRFSCPQPVPIENPSFATHLYRIAQEAVTNAVKHGRPDHIEIRLAEIPGRITLAVKDNGSGLSRCSPPTGMGLRIMRHRARAIEASLVVQRRPHGGTSVVCSVHKPGSTELPDPVSATRKKA